MSGDVKLAGTLMIPAAPGPYPAVVLFHGSGYAERNLWMARWFAEQGVAALAYDKRGAGESSGDFNAVPFMKLADDGLAAVDFLRARTDIDRHRIGVWGLSQGGWLGPLAASRSANVMFVISVSGPGVSPGEQMIFYYANDLRSRGLVENDVREASTLRREVWDSLHTGKALEQAQADLDRSRKAAWFNDLKSQQDGLFDRLKTPADWEKARSSIWFREEIDYDPIPTLGKLTVPALFIFGADDSLVPVPESVSAIRAVSNAGKKDFALFVVAGADHTLRINAADGGRMLSPEYLQHIQEWLAHNVLDAK
ncbi:MAG TPA: alpha/beta fold hydrolase [Candidatus Angelobacter sp.]